MRFEEFAGSGFHLLSEEESTRYQQKMQPDGSVMITEIEAAPDSSAKPVEPVIVDDDTGFDFGANASELDLNRREDAFQEAQAAEMVSEGGVSKPPVTTSHIAPIVIQGFTEDGSAPTVKVIDSDNSFVIYVGTAEIAKYKTKLGIDLEFLDQCVNAAPGRKQVCPRCKSGNKFKNCCETPEEKEIVMCFRAKRNEALAMGITLDETGKATTCAAQVAKDKIPMLTPTPPKTYGHWEDGIYYESEDPPSTRKPIGFVPPVSSSEYTTVKTTAAAKPDPKPLPKRREKKWTLEDIIKKKSLSEKLLAVYQVIHKDGPLTRNELNDTMRLETEIRPSYGKLLGQLERLGVIDKVGEKICFVTGCVGVAWDVTGEEPLETPIKNPKARVREVLALGRSPIDAIELFTRGIGWNIADIHPIPPKIPRVGQEKWHTTVTLTDNQIYKAKGRFYPGGVCLESWKAVE